MAVEKNVFPYKDGVQKRIVLGNYRTYEYRVPFNYENVNVVRLYNCGETHGLELNPINSYWPDPNHRPADYIEISEKEPIVRVEVIGSACTPPGYVQLAAEPLPGFFREDELQGVVACRFRINNLWGMHLRVDQWLSKIEVPRSINEEAGAYFDLPDKFVESNPALKGCRSKLDYREFPLTGLSCAVFSIPLSGKIRITGGSEVAGWVDDNFPDDAHYSFRIIRVTVCDILEK